MEAEGSTRITKRLLRAFSQGLSKAGYPTSYSGVSGEIEDLPSDGTPPYYDPETDHHQLRLAEAPHSVELPKEQN